MELDLSCLLSTDADRRGGLNVMPVCPFWGGQRAST